MIEGLICGFCLKVTKCLREVKAECLLSHTHTVDDIFKISSENKYTLLSKNVASRICAFVGQPNSGNVSILGAYGPPTNPLSVTDVQGVFSLVLPLKVLSTKSC